MVRARATYMFVLAATVVYVFLPLAAITAYAQTNQTTNQTNPLTRLADIAAQIAGTLKTIAYTVITIAAFLGVIHYALGRGPEWLGRAIMAAVAAGVVLWIIGQVAG